MLIRFAIVVVVAVLTLGVMTTPSSAVHCTIWTAGPQVPGSSGENCPCPACTLAGGSAGYSITTTYYGCIYDPHDCTRPCTLVTGLPSSISDVTCTGTGCNGITCTLYGPPISCLVCFD